MAPAVGATHAAEYASFLTVRYLLSLSLSLCSSVSVCAPLSLCSSLSLSLCAPLSLSVRSSSMIALQVLGRSRCLARG